MCKEDILIFLEFRLRTFEFVKKLNGFFLFSLPDAADIQWRIVDNDDFNRFVAKGVGVVVATADQPVRRQVQQPVEQRSNNGPSCNGFAKHFFRVLGVCIIYTILFLASFLSCKQEECKNFNSHFDFFNRYAQFIVFNLAFLTYWDTIWTNLEEIWSKFIKGVAKFPWFC